MRRAGEGAEGGTELGVAERAADGVELVPAQQLVERGEDRPAPARIGRVDGPGLGRRPRIVEDEAVAFLPHGQHDGVGAAVADLRDFHVAPLAPHAVRELGHLGEECRLGIVDDLAHHALDDVGAVARDELGDALGGGEVAGDLRAEVEGHEVRLAGGAQVDALDVAPQLAPLDDLDGRDQDALVEGVARVRAEAPRRDAAHVVLVQDIGDPAEELALPEDGIQQRHVHLVSGAHPGIVREEHVALEDAGVAAPVLERPLHLHVRHARHVELIGPVVDELAVLGEDRRVEVEGVHRDGRARDALDRHPELLVDRPQVVADDLVGDRDRSCPSSRCAAPAGGRSRASPSGYTGT